MPSLLKTTEAGALALHAAAFLAAQADRTCSAVDMARALQVSQAHLVKVLQRLCRAGLLHPIRGPHGGYRLAHPPRDIRLLAVFEAIEGPLTPLPCLFKNHSCRRTACILGNVLTTINHQVRDYFAQTTLAELAKLYTQGQKPASSK